MGKDLELLEVFLSIQAITKLGICIYDNSKILTSSFSESSRNFLGHYCSFCRNVRYLENGRECCNQSDRTQVVEFANSYIEPFFSTCHMGITEYIIPIKHSGRLISTIFLGQCNIIGETDFNTIAKNVRRLNGNPEEFRPYSDELPQVSRADLLHTGRLLTVCVEKIINEYGTDLVSTLSEQTDSNLVTDAINFMKNYYMLPISSSDISDALSVSLPYLSRLFKEKTNTTLLQYLTEIRINHAKHLLTESDISLQNISYNVGFNDQNYFTRVFQKKTGSSPLKYRKRFYAL